MREEVVWVLGGVARLRDLGAVVGRCFRWWGETEAGPPASTAKPNVVQEALALRPNTDGSDTHMVLWAIAAMLCCFAFRWKRARLTAFGSLWAHGCLIEIMQSLHRNPPSTMERPACQHHRRRPRCTHRDGDHEVVSTQTGPTISISAVLAKPHP